MSVPRKQRDAFEVTDPASDTDTHSDSITRQLAARFASWTGHPPLGIWSAPGRVNLIGEYLDLNGGLVLPLAIPQRARVALAERADGRLRVRSDQRPEVVEFEVGDLVPGQVSGWAGYLAGVLWAVRQHAGLDRGVDLWLDGRVPQGAGLSSSAAIECAAALGLGCLAELGYGAEQLARLAQSAEVDFMGVPSGLMDQMAAMCCQAGHALLFATDTGRTSQVRLPFASAEVELLVIDTRVRHQVAESGYADRRAACLRAAEELRLRWLAQASWADLGRLRDPSLRRRAQHVVSEQYRVRQCVDALQRGDLRTVGSLMVESHVSLRDDLEVSSPELDLAVETAMASGAIGARMTGSGFGGAAIALSPTPLAAKIGSEVIEAFARQRLRTPTVTAVTPSDGARREL
ncbi:MAG: galactokinase [Candidatus Dormiibacterota bacterium]